MARHVPALLLGLVILGGCNDQRQQEARSQIQALRATTQSVQQAERDQRRRLVQQVLERELAHQQERWRNAALTCRAQVQDRIEERRRTLRQQVAGGLDATAKPELEKLHTRLTAAQERVARGDVGALREAEGLKAAIAASLATVKRHQIALEEQIEQRLDVVRRDTLAELDRRRDTPPAILTEFRPEAVARTLVPDDDGAATWAGMAQGLDALDRYLQSSSGSALMLDGTTPRITPAETLGRRIDETIAGLNRRVDERTEAETNRTLERLATVLAAVTAPHAGEPAKKDG